MRRLLPLAAVLTLLMAATAQATFYHGKYPYTGGWKGKVHGGGKITFRVSRSGKRVSRVYVRARYRCTDSTGEHSAPGGKYTFRHRGALKLSRFGPASGAKAHVSVPGLSHKPVVKVFADDFYSGSYLATPGNRGTGSVNGGFNRANGDICSFLGDWKAKVHR